MKYLIVYYSFTQNNEKVAAYLGKQMNCDIVKLETVKKRTGLSILFDLMFGRKPALKPVTYYLKDYDHVIFIAPIWAGKIAMPLKSFLSSEGPNVGQYSFVTLCGGGKDQKRQIEKELVSILKRAPSLVVELWIKNLLPADKKDDTKYTSGYRISENELDLFKDQLQEIIRQCRSLAV